MTKEQLIEKLVEIAKHNGGDIEGNHSDADCLLLDFINDPEVREAYDKIDKWYA